MDPELYLTCVRAAEQLIDDDRVAEAWAQPSALTGYTVGGLAGHLARAVFTVETYLDADQPTSTDELTDAPGYFVAVLGSDDPVASDLHRRVRARGEETGGEGPSVLVSNLAEARGRLEARLDAASLRRVIEVRGGVQLTLDEYLRTRLVELVVHLDDLAVSIGQDEPEGLPVASYDLVVAVLAQVAARRAGRLTMVRSLARRERAPAEIRAL